MKMRVGYIVRYDVDVKENPDAVRFKLIEESYTRRITSRGDRVFSKMFLYPVDYEEIASNTRMMKENPSMILVREPFFLDEDEELRNKVTNWVEWANKADPKEYDPFAT